jgi:xylose isomerase
MGKPLHKYSVILNNYRRPSDRFMAGGYAMEADKRTTVELIELAGRQGVVQGIEMIAVENEGEIGVGTHNQREIAAVLRDNGLALTGVMPNLWGAPWQQYGTLGAADPSTRRRSIDLCKKAMDLAAACGGEYVGLWPGQDGSDYVFEADYQRMWEWWVEGVQELADHNPSLRIGLEPKPNEPRAYPVINSAAKALVLIGDIGRENVGVCLDVGHSLFSAENVAETVAMLQGRGRRLFHLHMNDNYNTADLDMIFGSVHTLEFIEAFYWLHRTGYTYFMSVDLFAYRTDATRSVEQSVRWMQAMDAFVERCGMERLGALIAEADPTAATAFFREQMFGK